MDIETQVADAVARNVPLVVVGGTPLLALVLSTARSLGLATAQIGVDAVARVEPLGCDASSRIPHLVVVTGCADASDDDAILDLAFDGDSRLPADHVVALHFTSPTTCSDALADLASELGHCVLVHDDLVVESPLRLAA